VGIEHRLHTATLRVAPVPAVLEWRQRMAEEAVRRGDPEELLPRHAAFVDWMRKHAADPRHMPHVLSTGGWPEMQWSRVTGMSADRWRISVVDGSNMSRSELKQAASQWVTDAIEGRAPAFRQSAAVISFRRTAPELDRGPRG
jgi:hypothetical protein